ncbi:MAG: M28 family peptidase [Bacteroidales bacterium]|nr:M28 family peptidase [Bacteroidales bacterium]
MLLLGLGCGYASAQTVRTATEAAAQNLVRGKFLEDKVGRLCDTLCAGRAAGTRGSSEAAYFLIDQLRGYGLDPYVLSSKDVKGPAVHNIIAPVPASTASDKYIIVGAHYDNLGKIGGNIYPGADSNASGVAVSLALAKMFAYLSGEGRTIKSNILFVFFDGKEANLSGSGALWNAICSGRLQDRASGRIVTRDRVALMINIEQIGCTLSPVNEGRPNYLLMLGNKSIPSDRQDVASYVNRFSDTRLDLEYSYYGSKKFTQVFYRLSDQRAFVDNRIPTVLFTSGITMNTNKTWDTPDTIDYDVLLKRTFLIYHWLYRML